MVQSRREKNPDIWLLGKIFGKGPKSFQHLIIQLLVENTNIIDIPVTVEKRLKIIEDLVIIEKRPLTVSTTNTGLVYWPYSGIKICLPLSKLHTICNKTIQILESH